MVARGAREDDKKSASPRSWKGSLVPFCRTDKFPTRRGESFAAAKCIHVDPFGNTWLRARPGRDVRDAAFRRRGPRGEWGERAVLYML